MYHPKLGVDRKPKPGVRGAKRLLHRLARGAVREDETQITGALGQRIYEHVSEEAWEMWEERMKMILNEYRLLPFQKEAQQLIAKQMEEFFFGADAALPPGYVPEDRH